MYKNFIEDLLFQNIDYTENELVKGEYENCTFSNCIFTNINLSDINFVECIMENCDFTMVKLSNVGFRDVKFRECKLIGLRFEDCSDFLFAVDFESCQLNLSSFYQRTLMNTRFKDCIMHEVDFTEADLGGSTFEKSDLSGAIFSNSILEKVDFREAYNYSIDPEQNRIKKAKFSIHGLAGLLFKYEIEVE